LTLVSGAPVRSVLSPADRAWLVFVVVLVGWVSLTVVFPALPGVPCLFRWATGHACLGCGLTRACQALVRGDVRGAFAHHPLVGFVVVAAAVPTLRLVTAWRWGTAWPGRLPAPLLAIFWAAFGAGVVVVAVDRAPPIVAAILR
jgi:hypothetical protein